MIEKLEKLASLRLEEAERKKILKDVEEILHWVEVLKEIDTEGVPPTTHPFLSSLPLREDKPETSLSDDEVFKNAKGKSGRFFKIRRPGWR
ncbi:Asp-tRNA(Asn)/Glu-tRNA(Gln) amidotransferase GatCAB subunit C [bacterium]|nr:MAG: Asp-tRNA(Asn)/Glu-tRNA(Gln) amidotransferase GatCAB subunit C [bacterium]